MLFIQNFELAGYFWFDYFKKKKKYDCFFEKVKNNSCVMQVSSR